MLTPNDDKMQFVNTNYSDLEGDLASNTKSSKTITDNFNKASTTINLNESGPSSSNNNNTNNSEMISTLDEPVSVTINRDLKAVFYKFGHVFFPKQSNLLLKDWDLWGPMTLCVILSISLKGESTQSTDRPPEFASIFFLIAFGAIVVTLNTKLLSGKISFFQSICVLGYCLLPLVLVSFSIKLVKFVIGKVLLVSFPFNFILAMLACGWSVFASTAFLAADTLNLVDRKALAIYPIFLFYFVIGWLIILDTF